MTIKKLKCKILGHTYSYIYGWMPTQCEYTRCGMKWKTINNPEYTPGKSNILEVDLHLWVEVKDGPNE